MMVLYINKVPVDQKHLTSLMSHFYGYPDLRHLALSFYIVILINIGMEKLNNKPALFHNISIK